MKEIKKILNNPKILKVYKNIQNEKVLKLKLECRSQCQSDKALVSFTIVYGWEHLSVSFKNKIPSWETMCEFKEMFWNDDEDAFQYHPIKDNYINNNEYTLHMWRPLTEHIPVPPSILVGIRPNHLEEDKQAAKELQKYIGSPISDAELDLMIATTTPEGKKQIQEKLNKMSNTDFLNLCAKMGII